MRSSCSLAAAVSGPVLDALDVSRPAVRLAVGIVGAVAGLVRLARRAPAPEPGGGWLGGALVPVAVPLVAAPALVVLGLSAGADLGVLFVDRLPGPRHRCPDGDRGDAARRRVRGGPRPCGASVSSRWRASWRACCSSSTPSSPSDRYGCDLRRHVTQTVRRLRPDRAGTTGQDGDSDGSVGRQGGDRDGWRARAGRGRGPPVRARGREGRHRRRAHRAGEALAAELGDDAVFVRHDVADEVAWEAVVATAVDRFGGVARAGQQRRHRPHRARSPTTPSPTTSASIAVNQTGVFLGMRSVIGPMTQAGGGSIVNISSGAGLRATKYMIAYAASKYAVTGMTAAGALELARYGIRVNSIHPGVVDTPMLGAEFGTPNHDALVRTTPLRRMASPDEIANVALFLASDEASYMTGAHVPVDGGITA